MILPTFAAVAAAGLGVTGIAGGAHFVGGAAGQSGDTTALSDAVSGRGSSAQSHSNGRHAGSGADASAEASPSSSASGGAHRADQQASEDEIRAHEKKQRETVVTSSKPQNSLASGKQTFDRTAIEAEREERAQRAARAARERAESSGDPKEIARALAAERGWGDEEFSCLEQMWSNESGWDTSAENPSSGAYGIPQALPGSKMGEFGPDWQHNPKTQIKWGLHYVATRYDTPCGAWSFWQSNNWY